MDIISSTMSLCVMVSGSVGASFISDVEAPALGSSSEIIAGCLLRIFSQWSRHMSAGSQSFSERARRRTSCNTSTLERHERATSWSVVSRAHRTNSVAADVRWYALSTWMVSNGQVQGVRNGIHGIQNSWKLGFARDLINWTTSSAAFLHSVWKYWRASALYAESVLLISYFKNTLEKRRLFTFPEINNHTCRSTRQTSIFNDKKDKCKLLEPETGAALSCCCGLSHSGRASSQASRSARILLRIFDVSFPGLAWRPYTRGSKSPRISVN